MRAFSAMLGVFVVVAGLLTIPASAATVEVQVFDSEFSPDPTINVGDTVRWVWDSFMDHNVRSAPWEAVAVFNSGYHAGTTHTFEYTFTNPGVVDYYCDLHGFPVGDTIVGMAGQITVVVPEPAGCAVLAPAVMLLARRRRRWISRR